MTKQIPGLVNAHLLSAVVRMVLGDPLEAHKSISKVLEMDQSNEEAYIMHALISIKTDNLKSASTQLNQAIS